MEVKATVRHITIAPQKLRLVVDKVRGVDADEALAILKFMPQKGAHYVQKAVESALANARNNFDLNTSNMVVRTIYADEGPTMKRYKAGARGRYKPRRRRTSHLTVILAERGDE